MSKNYLRLLVIGLAVLTAGVFMLAKVSRATNQGVFIQAGDDGWNTPNDGGTSDELNVPADFFGAGSLAYTGTVVMTGDPSGGSDTVIARGDNVTVAGPGTSGTTSLKMTQLSLKGVSPINVSFRDGHTEAWNVSNVTMSSLKASAGSMTINGDGTFSSNLSVYPKFTFRRVSDGATKILDTGSPTLQAILMAQAREFDATKSEGMAPCKVVGVEVEAAAAGCAPINFRGNGTWSCCPFRPKPLTERDLLIKHGVIPPCGRAKIEAGKDGNVPAPVPCTVVD